MKPTDTHPLSNIQAGQTVILVDILVRNRSAQRLAELGQPGDGFGRAVAQGHNCVKAQPGDQLVGCSLS